MNNVTIQVDPFKNETGLIVREVEHLGPVGRKAGGSFCIVLDSTEKWNRRKAMLLHADEVEIAEIC